MSEALELLLDALAAYRLTKLATDDSITQGPRDAVIRWSYERVGRTHGTPVSVGRSGAWQDTAAMDPHPPKIAELVICRWCAGMWVSAGVVLASRLAPRAWRPLARVLALSAAAALVARLED